MVDDKNNPKVPGRTGPSLESRVAALEDVLREARLLPPAPEKEDKDDSTNPA